MTLLTVDLITSFEGQSALLRINVVGMSLSAYSSSNSLDWVGHVYEDILSSKLLRYIIIILEQSPLFIVKETSGKR